MSLNSPPIPVKFTDPVTGIKCDVNVNDRLGLINTEMISHYMTLSPVLRPLLIVIKHWAKHTGLYASGPQAGPRLFNSYALNLMTIAVLQVTSHAFVIIMHSSMSHLGLLISPAAKSSA